MAENKQDELIRVYVTLKSLRENIGQMTDYSVQETYVHEFHTVLDRLESIGIDVAEFRIPSSQVNRVARGGSYLTGETRYSDEKYVDKTFILTKLDAILGYFEIITSKEPRKIGFSK